MADEQNQSVPKAADPTAVGQGNAQASSKAESELDEIPPGNGNRTMVVIAVVLLLILAAGFFYWRATFTEDTDDAQVDGNLYQISARISGQVVKVYVDDNQTVQAGQLLAEIDPTDYQVALDQAQANLASAQAEYAQATVNVPITQVTVGTTVSTTASDVKGSTDMVAQAEKQVEAANARVEEAKANAQKAQDDVDRYTPLVQKDVISKQQYDAAVAAAAASKAAVAEAEASVLAASERGCRRAPTSRPVAGPVRPIGEEWSRPGEGAAVPRRGRRGRHPAGAGQGRSGQAEPWLHAHHRAGSGNREQEERRGGRQPCRRTGPDDHHPADRPVGDSQLQGDATDPHARRTEQSRSRWMPTAGASSPAR